MNIVIAHFNAHYANMIGGVEKVTAELANAMVERGHQVTILYIGKTEGSSYFPVDPRVPEHNVLFEHGKPVVSARLSLSGRILREAVRLFSQKQAQAVNAKAKGKAYGPRIRMWMEKIKPDVIVSTSAPSTKYIVEDAGCTIPVVTMIHSQPIVQFKSLSKVERRAVEKSAALQILLPSGMTDARKYFPHLPIYVIGNAAGTPRMKADVSVNKQQYIISCVGIVNGNKNQKLLAEAFASLAGEFPNWSIECWGKISNEYIGAIRKIIKAAHLEERVRFLGPTKNVDKDIYSRSDILAIPSKAEGFPLSLTEGMAAGLPAVGLASAPGVKDLIQDGVTGFLTDGTVKGYAAALRKLMESQSLRVQMGQAGEKAISAYAPEIVWKQWEDLLEKVAGEYRK